MAPANRDRVGRALDALGPYLATYVAQRLSEVVGARRLERADTQALVKAMLEHWERAFARELPSAVRHYVHELRDVRNRWAHEEPFTDTAARRAVDTVSLVAEAIGAPASLLQTVRALSPAAGGGTERPPAARRDAKPAAPRPAAARPESAAVRRDVNGIIVNAAELTADDVALQPVLCPACERKVFKSWPLGWDAHAAHPCPGVAMGTGAERKAEYRRRYGHLFRDGGPTTYSPAT